MSRSSVHSDIISDIKLPLVVNVMPDSIHKVEIPLVKTGGLTGKIILEENSKLDIFRNNQEKPIILVKLISEKESFLTQVNSKNEFSFKEIRPNTYKITAMVVGKEQQFSIENPERVLVVESGILQDVNFVLKPVERKIYFSNQVHELSLKK